ncbi:response regulator [Paenibacillus sp. LMG 31458]|uniref:Response regulator n=1 Tax=Paenibacillus phytorum TaxID=2654977 RepID=A0ABX1XSR7_9BACL|nr:response regulator [Paenibacillus phytorum]NOU70996.1 response regulator [Paenibacillus phytorum]
MWKVLLVEDEAIVRRSIIGIIDWEAFGFRVVAEAEDGERALKEMECHRPDLVISDIVMPNLNGLELLRQAREKDFDGVFIMLTAMNEFEYAQQALEYGATGYLLKLSMSPESLQTTLDKVSRQLTKRAQERSHTELYTAYPKEWEAIMNGNLRESSVVVSESSAMQEPRDDAWGQVIICTALDGGEGFDAKLLDSWKLMEWHTPPLAHQYAALGMTSVFLWSSKPPRWLSGIPRPGQIPFAVSCLEKGTYASFTRDWQLALRRLDASWYSGKPGWFRVISGSEDALPSAFWRGESERLRQLGRSGPSGMMPLLQEAWTDMERDRISWYGVKTFALRALDIIADGRGEALAYHKSQVTRASSHAQCLRTMAAAVDSLLTLSLSRKGETDHPEVNRIMAYIQDHYDRNISVKAMAEMVQLDEKYLSGLFHKKTGESLIQYVQRIRVEKAKEALRFTEVPVNEIGELVGFLNPNYFYRTFKKWTHQTPSDYRRGD